MNNSYMNAKMNDDCRKAIREMVKDQYESCGVIALAERGILTPNEVRAYFNLPIAVKGGDDLK